MTLKPFLLPLFLGLMMLLSACDLPGGEVDTIPGTQPPEDPGIVPPEPGVDPQTSGR